MIKLAASTIQPIVSAIKAESNFTTGTVEKDMCDRPKLILLVYNSYNTGPNTGPKILVQSLYIHTTR